MARDNYTHDLEERLAAAVECAEQATQALQMLRSTLMCEITRSAPKPAPRSSPLCPTAPMTREMLKVQARERLRKLRARG